MKNLNKYSPTVLKAYEQNPNWFRKAFPDRDYDDEHYDRYGQLEGGYDHKDYDMTDRNRRCVWEYTPEEFKKVYAEWGVNNKGLPVKLKCLIEADLKKLKIELSGLSRAYDRREVLWEIKTLEARLDSGDFA